MPPHRRYSVTMEIPIFPFLSARKFSRALRACALILPLCCFPSKLSDMRA